MYTLNKKKLIDLHITHISCVGRLDAGVAPFLKAKVLDMHRTRRRLLAHSIYAIRADTLAGANINKSPFGIGLDGRLIMGSGIAGELR